MLVIFLQVLHIVLQDIKTILLSVTHTHTKDYSFRHYITSTFIIFILPLLFCLFIYVTLNCFLETSEIFNSVLSRSISNVYILCTLVISSSDSCSCLNRIVYYSSTNFMCKIAWFYQTLFRRSPLSLHSTETCIFLRTKTNQHFIHKTQQTTHSILFFPLSLLT